MKTLSVSEYLTLVNETLALIPSTEFCVEGEVSEYRVSQNKWIHFVLKDGKEEASVACFATIYQLPDPLQDGMRVQVMGYARVFERFGKFSLNVRQVLLVGEGALRKAYEAMKKRLDAEGLFDGARKRTLPRFPSRVGLITSKDAAAYTDFLRIARNRWGAAEIEHYHVQVQGQDAVQNILDAFHYFQNLPAAERPHVLVLTRGGGSLEDLHAFNDECVARAVFGSPIPVVVGVGHERDESLCDFVADVRASTPSNAAEIIFPDRRAVLAEVSSATFLLETRLARTLEEHRATLVHVSHATFLFFARLEHHLFDCVRVLVRVFDPAIHRYKEMVLQSERFLGQVDPKRILGRGYALVRHRGRVLKDASLLEVREGVAVQLAHGSFEAEVTKV